MVCFKRVKLNMQLVTFSIDTCYILTINCNIILLWNRFKLWPFRLQVQMCLTSERDSVFVSCGCKAEHRGHIDWLLRRIAKSLVFDNCVSHVEPYSEILNRCYIVDDTCDVIFLIFCQHTIGRSAGSDINGFWEGWSKSTGYQMEVFSFLSVLIKECDLL